jgi:hypothetical protein
MYVGHLRKYRSVFKHLISGTARKKGRSVNKKRDGDNFCNANIRQLIYRKYSEGRILVIE